MRYISFLFLAVLIILGCNIPQKFDLVLDNASLVDVNTGKIGKFNIGITDGLIKEISIENLNGQEKIDIKDKYVIPGLWDMHVHVHGKKEKLKRFVEHGVLGIRDMGAFTKANVDSLIRWKKLKEYTNDTTIPDIYFSGLINNDSTCYNDHNHVGSLKDLNASLSYLNNIGAKFYKVHNCFPKELITQLDSLSNIHDLKIVGHIPEGIDPIEYIKFNISSIEHISIPVRALSFREENPLNMIQAIQLLDGEYLDSLGVAMKKNGIAFSPNLLSEKTFLNSYSEEQKPMGEALFKKYLSYTKRIANKDVLLFISTDTGLETIMPGESIHQEMQLLSEAGLSNLKILQCATINPIKYFENKNRVDPYAIGRKANFIILNTNPLDNINNTQDIFGVINN